MSVSAWTKNGEGPAAGVTVRTAEDSMKTYTDYIGKIYAILALSVVHKINVLMQTHTHIAMTEMYSHLFHRGTSISLLNFTL